MTNDRLKLVAPRIAPALDPEFRPASLANRGFRREVESSGGVRVRIALEQADGSVFHFKSRIFPEQHPSAAGNFRYLERYIKFLLWSRGGFRIYFDGPAELHRRLVEYYQTTPTGQFDAEIMGGRIYEKPFAIVRTDDLP